MFAKLTARNRLTLPRRAPEALGMQAVPTYFRIKVDAGRIILTPTHGGAANAVRRKLAELGVADADVTDAIRWARGSSMRDPGNRG